MEIQIEYEMIAEILKIYVIVSIKECRMFLQILSYFKLWREVGQKEFDNVPLLYFLINI